MTISPSACPKCGSDDLLSGVGLKPASTGGVDEDPRAIAERWRAEER